MNSGTNSARWSKAAPPPTFSSFSVDLLFFCDLECFVMLTAYARYLSEAFRQYLQKKLLAGALHNGLV